MKFRKAVIKALSLTGYSIVRSERLERYKIRSQILKDFGANKDQWRILLLSAVSESAGFKALTWLPESRSQLYQDVFALGKSGLKRGGYFVEFGASDGVSLSNTYLLEKFFGWTGILAEPAEGWYPALRDNRSVIVEKLCVFSISGQAVAFNETPSRVLSTIDSFTKSDHHGEAREGGERYEVQTISLADLLSKHDAPRHIDYLSIDTEGSELEILEAFDFSSRSFGVITVEHNRTEQREKINKILTRHGYERWRPDVTRFDDWYVNQGAIQGAN